MPNGDTSRPRIGSITIARIAGVELRAHWSLALIFALLAVNLGAGLFPAWHPDWGPLLAWTTAISAAFLFFVSIALHELSHAFVGRRNGVPIHKITLFIFGGMAHMEGEPPSARAEFRMAIVGPITSLLIGVAAMAAGLWIAGGAIGDDAGAEETLRAIGPLPTLLLWLGPVNLFLGLFNLIPGFPLDGGRVLRAAVWRATRDFARATRVAAAVGRLFGLLLVGTGAAMIFGVVVPFLGGGAVQGLWLVLIGWFLAMAARSSLDRLRMREAMERRRRIAEGPPPVAVEADLPLPVFVAEYMLAFERRTWPVVRDGSVVGSVDLAAVKAVPPEMWPNLVVADVMTAAAPIEERAGEPGA